MYSVIFGNIIKFYHFCKLFVCDSYESGGVKCMHVSITSSSVPHDGPANLTGLIVTTNHFHVRVTLKLFVPWEMWSMVLYGYNASRKSEVLRVRYRTSSPWYSQFRVVWLQRPQIWLGTRISLVILVLVSREKICRVQARRQNDRHLVMHCHNENCWISK